MNEKSKSLNPYLIPGAVVIAGILVSLSLIFTADSEKGSVVAQNTGVDSAIEIEGWPSMGDPNAPVVMVEYSDYACPFCGRFWEETLPIIKEEYIDTGKVRFIYKDFAVVGGAKAAEAAHCAEEQGAYWKYHDHLFENIGDRGLWDGDFIHGEYADELGLDREDIIECFNSGRYSNKVAESTREAQLMGAGGTPYFIINKRNVSGAQPISAFRDVIDIELRATE